MPVVTVNVWEEVLDSGMESRLIAALTDDMVDALGEQVRPFTTVMVIAVPQRRWGTAGVPSTTAFAD